jgi:hypothetical protein
MGAEEITFEELLTGEPARLGLPMSFKELLADGFPCQAGLAGLAAIEQMPDPGPQFAEIRRRYLQIVELQRRGVQG